MARPNEVPQLTIAGVIAVLIAVGGYLVYQAPLRSSRPTSPELAEQKRLLDVGVEARLWQDPFSAVEQYRRLRTERYKDADAIRATERPIERAIEASHLPVHVLGVMVDVAAYAEAVEQRLRMRYVSGLALNVAGYEAVHTDRLGYFTVGSGPSATVVPFEWYQRRGERGALVVWIPDGSFSEIGPVIERLRAVLPRASVSLIGPNSSSTVAAMMSEAPAAVGRTFAGVQMYSYRATADDVFFLDEDGTDAAERRRRLVRAFADRGVVFHRTIGSDALLADALLDELARRQIRLGADHIAIVSELDTYYGRVLPATFAGVLEAKTMAAGSDAGALIDDVATGRRHWPATLHHYSYLNGLDGEVPSTGGDKGRTPRGGADGGQSGKRPDASTLERPEGASQVDYVRRLALKIKDDNKQLRREGKAYKAIGILGSDVYDKLLLLQALRKELTNTIFFTTDMDARLFHPAEFDWTRNLLIASHFGLQLNDDIQGFAPPFRDGYQTALYLALLRVLGHLTPCSVPTIDEPSCFMHEGRPFTADLPARLYEVGRTGAVDISVDPEPTPPSLHHPRPPLLPPYITLKVFDIRFGFFATVLLIGLLMAVLAVATINPLWVRTRGLLRAAGRRPLVAAAVAAAVTWGLIALRGWIMADGRTGEPLSIMQGVSVWPTEAARVLAAGLGAAFLLSARSRLRANARRIAREFQLRRADRRATVPGRGWWKRACEWARASYRHERWLYEAVGTTTKPIDARELWTDYLDAGAWRYSAPRVLGMLGAYVLLTALLFSLFDEPARPCRGEVSCTADLIALALSLAAVLTVNIVIFDLVRQCRAWIERLRAQPTLWPEATLRAHARATNVPADLLEDWLDVRIIAERTKAVGALVVYPFLVLLLAMIARNRYFDNWDFPLSLVAAWALNMALVLGAAIVLKRAAERARNAAVAHLEDLYLVLTGEGGRLSHRAEQVRTMIDRIRDMREGAFNSILQQPAVSASLLGALALLQYFLPV